MKQDDIIERLDDYIEFDAIMSQSAFASKAGIDPSGFLKMMKGQQTITDNTLKKIADCYGLRMEWLKFGEGEQYKPKKETSSLKDIVIETRPRIPATAAAGSLSDDAIGVTLSDCEQLPIINQLPAYDFTIIIKGDSMKPKYESGDEIACRRILNPSFIQWGKVHVLDTAQGIVVKKVYDDGDSIKCVSINPDYPPFSVPKDEVYSLSLVVGSLSITEM